MLEWPNKVWGKIFPIKIRGENFPQIFGKKHWEKINSQCRGIIVKTKNRPIQLKYKFSVQENYRKDSNSSGTRKKFPVPGIIVKTESLLVQRKYKSPGELAEMTSQWPPLPRGGCCWSWYPWHFFCLKDKLLDVRLFWDLIKTMTFSWYLTPPPKGGLPWRHFRSLPCCNHKTLPTHFNGESDAVL